MIERQALAELDIAHPATSDPPGGSMATARLPTGRRKTPPIGGFENAIRRVTSQATLKYGEIHESNCDVSEETCGEQDFTPGVGGLPGRRGVVRGRRAARGRHQ